MKIKPVLPLRTETEYTSFRRREIPSAQDKLMAVKLLRRLTLDDFKELWAWNGNGETLIRNIARGVQQHGMMPTRFLRVVSAQFKLKWRGCDYVKTN